MVQVFVWHSQEVVGEVGHEHAHAHCVNQHTAPHALPVVLGNVAGDEGACRAVTGKAGSDRETCMQVPKVARSRQVPQGARAFWPSCGTEASVPQTVGSMCQCTVLSCSTMPQTSGTYWPSPQQSKHGIGLALLLLVRKHTALTVGVCHKAGLLHAHDVHHAQYS